MNSIFQTLLRRVITKTNLVFLMGLQNALSILSVFSSPIRIPPKTSIGLLTGISVVIVLFLFYLYKKKKIILGLSFQIVDFCVYGFVVVNALSLIFSQYIFDITNFRLLLIALVQYVAIRFVDFSENDKQKGIHIIGVVTIMVAIISLFQMLFRDQAIMIAQKFLFGDAAYSIARDLARGRGVQWGNIVLTFPFFFYSAMLLRKTKKIYQLLYLYMGVFLVPFSFVVSNFRGLTLCFFIGAVGYIYAIFYHHFLPLKKLVPLFVSMVFAVSIGIGLASLVFQYNLIDRFLFKEQDRDIQFTIGRIPLYEQALTTFVASPFVGVGLGNYRYEVDHIQGVAFYNVINGETGVKETEREPVSSHNDIVTILAETGLFGLIFYIGIFYSVVKNLWTYMRSKKNGLEKQILAPLTFMISLLMLIISGVFENTPANNIVYLFFLFGASATWFQAKMLSVDVAPPKKKIMR